MSNSHETPASHPLPSFQATYSLGPDSPLSMPAVGLGTFQVKEQAGYEAVKAAIKVRKFTGSESAIRIVTWSATRLGCKACAWRAVSRDAHPPPTPSQVGYTHIDTASVYRNEAAVGRAIRESNVPRHELFLTTKLAPKDQGAGKAYASLCRSLSELGLDYVDLYLIHWPAASGLKHDDPLNRIRRHESYVELQQGVREGKIKNLGVSNFEIRHLTALLADPAVTYPPSVNQVECHPLYPQIQLREYCRKHGILIQAYSSLGQGKQDLLAHPVVTSTATKRGMTPAQVLLRWALQQGIPVLPKTTNTMRMTENLGALNKELQNEDMHALNGLDESLYRKFAWDPCQVF